MPRGSNITTIALTDDTGTVTGRANYSAYGATTHAAGEIVLTRYTQPEKDLLLLLEQLKMTLPEQAPPKIYSHQLLENPLPL